MYRHAGACKSILESLGLWKYVVAFVIAVMSTVLAKITELPLWGEVLMGILAFAVLILAVAVISTISTIWIIKTSQDVAIPSEPIPEPGMDGSDLEYSEWASGNTLTLPRPSFGISTSWVAIRCERSAQTAKNVIARIDFVNSEKTIAAVVPEVKWYGFTHTDSGLVEGWRPKVDIDPGEEQWFVFLTEDQKNQVYAIKGSGDPVNVLSKGDWIGHIVVESDNMRGFEGEFKFKVTRMGHAPRHNTKFFTKLRSLPPRLSIGRCSLESTRHAHSNQPALPESPEEFGGRARSCSACETEQPNESGYRSS